MARPGLEPGNTIFRITEYRVATVKKCLQGGCFLDGGLTSYSYWSLADSGGLRTWEVRHVLFVLLSGAPETRDSCIWGWRIGEDSPTELSVRKPTGPALCRSEVPLKADS